MTGKTEEKGKEQEVLKGLYGPQKRLLKESHVPQSGVKAYVAGDRLLWGLLCHLGHFIELECPEPFAQKLALCLVPRL